MPSFELDFRTRLRLLDDTDAEELYEVVQANRDHLARWMPWASGQTLDTTREFILLSQRQLADRLGLQTAIVRDGAIVGTIGFHRLDWQNLSTSIGYWIAESAQGQGTVTAAVRALADYAFAVWRLNRIEIRAGTENRRSRAIPERLGFTEEGVLRQAERLGDGFVDHVVYAMLAKDWVRQPPPSSA